VIETTCMKTIGKNCLGICEAQGSIAEGALNSKGSGNADVHVRKSMFPT